MASLHHTGQFLGFLADAASHTLYATVRIWARLRLARMSLAFFVVSTASLVLF